MKASSSEKPNYADDIADLESFDIREAVSADVDSPIIEPGDQLTDEAGGDPEAGPGGDFEFPELMGPEEFAEVACFALALPGSFIPKFAPLAIQENEKPVADEGFAAVHRLILKSPSLHFMLSSPSGWMGDAMALFALGGLLMSKGAAIRAAGRAEREAANDTRAKVDPEEAAAAVAPPPAVADDPDGQEVGKA